MIFRRVGLGPTAKVAAAWAVIMVMLAATVAAVAYVVGGTIGVVADIDRIARRLFNVTDFHLTAAMFIAGLAGLAALAGLVGVGLAVIGATIYNHIVVLVGGLHIRLPAAASGEPEPARGGRG